MLLIKSHKENSFKPLEKYFFCVIILARIPEICQGDFLMVEY